jgi:cold shock protein
MGTVKWFKPDKGYGFIRPEDGDQDVFVHISAVQKAGYTSLAEGARVSYELVAGRSGKVSAENLRVTLALRLLQTNKLGGGCYLPMGLFVFEPIHVNANAPGGACVLRTFAEVGAFVLNAVDLPRRLSPH